MNVHTTPHWLSQTHSTATLFGLSNSFKLKPPYILVFAEVAVPLHAILVGKILQGPQLGKNIF